MIICLDATHIFNSMSLNVSTNCLWQKEFEHSPCPGIWWQRCAPSRAFPSNVPQLLSVIRHLNVHRTHATHGKRINVGMSVRLHAASFKSYIINSSFRQIYIYIWSRVSYRMLYSSTYILYSYVMHAYQFSYKPIVLLLVYSTGTHSSRLARNVFPDFPCDMLHYVSDACVANYTSWHVARDKTHGTEFSVCSLAMRIMPAVRCLQYQFEPGADLKCISVHPEHWGNS